ncbi:hypothetical protein pipiens_005518 [Culex pipiens pipiens]|uniref:Uncharacterized protein n=1 Tax=Culex pipiens pipiens TaxID=38569 RepID=A0ABD1DVZ5_CULPP
MSTQSYYKDRLGFDPREALADNNNGDVSPPLKSPHQRHSVSGGAGSASKHYYSNNGGGSPSPSGYNNGNGNGGDYYSRASPAKRHKHSSFSHGASPVTGSPLNVTSQGGYEDALTQFKDERDAIQKKTFTKWVNKHLKKVRHDFSTLFRRSR